MRPVYLGYLKRRTGNSCYLNYVGEENEADFLLRILKKRKELKWKYNREIQVILRGDKATFFMGLVGKYRG